MKSHDSGGKFITQYELMRRMTVLKRQKEYEWLAEISNTSLKIIAQDVITAYKNFFDKRSAFPKFKGKKKQKMVFPVRYDRMYFKDGYVRIEKIGFIKYKTDFNLEQGFGAKFYNPKISFNRANNKFFLSFGVEVENQNLDLQEYNVGIDLGIKELAVISYGSNSEYFHNINKTAHMRKLLNELKLTQRALSRKYRSNPNRKTNNIVKLENKVRKLYYKITNIRDNYIHQITHYIVKLAPSRIVMEDLDVMDMMKNKYLAKFIFQQCFYKFQRYLQYKCEFYGVPFVKANRYFPSSKKCSCCGNIKTITLMDRIYNCDVCGLVIDRDLNAAINLENY